MRRWVSLIILFAGGCDSSIAPGPEQDTSGDTQPENDLGEVKNGEVVERTIDASDADRWVYLDLDDNALVMPAEPTSARNWDLSFKRFNIAMNGGVSGQGDVEVAVVQGTAFDDVKEAPNSAFIADAADGSDDDLEPDYAMSTGGSGWYDYDPATHTLAPRDQVYVLRTTTRAVFKLQVLDYYSEAGSSGYLTLRYAQLVAGEGDTQGGSGGIDATDAGFEQTPDAGPSDSADAGTPEPDAGLPATFSRLTVDATAADTWSYIAVGKGIVAVIDPQTTSWDLAFQRTRIQTNGGTSGPGMGAARLLEGEFEDVLALPTSEGFESDALLPIPGPPGSGEFSGNPVLNAWYDYDATTHAVSPKALAYLLRTASGGYAKLRITQYTAGVFSIDLGGLTE